MSAAAMAPTNTRSTTTAVQWYSTVTNAIPGAIGATIQVVGEPPGPRQRYAGPARPARRRRPRGGRRRGSRHHFSARRYLAQRIDVLLSSRRLLSAASLDCWAPCSPPWRSRRPSCCRDPYCAGAVAPRRAAALRREPPTPTEQPDEPPPASATPARKGLGLWSKVRSRVERDDDDEPVVVGAVEARGVATAEAAADRAAGHVAQGVQDGGARRGRRDAARAGRAARPPQGAAGGDQALARVAARGHPRRH